MSTGKVCQAFGYNARRETRLLRVKSSV
jgi:hypothetical protein